MLLLLANSHAFPLRTHYFNSLLAGVGFAVVAACRYKLLRLWLLAGGTVLLALNGSGHLLMSCPMQIVEHDTLMKYLASSVQPPE